MGSFMLQGEWRGGLAIRQYKFPKLKIIHTPLESNACCYEHVVGTTTDRGTGNPQIPSNLAPTSRQCVGLMTHVVGQHQSAAKTANFHNRIINSENSFNHLLSSDAQG